MIITEMVTPTGDSIIVVVIIVVIIVVFLDHPGVTNTIHH